MNLALSIPISRTSNEIKCICHSLCFSVCLSTSLCLFLSYSVNMIFFMVRSWSWKSLRYCFWETLFLWPSFPLAVYKKGPHLYPLSIIEIYLMGRTSFASQTLGIRSPGNIFYRFPTIIEGKDRKKKICYSFPASLIVIGWKECWMNRYVTSNMVHTPLATHHLYILFYWSHNLDSC